MISVTVKRFVNFSQQPVITVELPDGTDVTDLIRQIGLPLAEVGALSINGQQVLLDQKLHNLDFVSIIPPIGGG